MASAFDSSAMIAYLAKEPGWKLVAERLCETDTVCYVHVINLCEVFYDYHRSTGEEAAQTAVQTLLKAGIVPRADMDDAFWQDVGRLKSVHRRVSLADCFCIALARRVGGELLTADHHEFDRIVPFRLCPVRFIR